MNSLLLLSGGLDSSVLLGHILSLGKKCIALSFDYGQRHKKELESAKKIAAHYSIEHYIIYIDSQLFTTANCSLTNNSLNVTVENTYVPARNLLFLAHALSFAESRNISEIYFGANAQDTTHFPDCKRTFFDSVEISYHLGTKTNPCVILTPFSSFSKKQIIALGNELSVPMQLTLSCYNPILGKSCGCCQACMQRENLSAQTI